MLLLMSLWSDEAGAVLSAEAVMVGTVGVLGATVGLGAAADAIDGELREFGSAIRSLDQSYTIGARRSCNAWTAGSCFVQREVEESVSELGERADVPVIDGETRTRRDSAKDVQGREPHVTPEEARENDIRPSRERTKHRDRSERERGGRDREEDRGDN